MLRDGRRVTALEVQWGLYERAKKYEQSHGLDAVDGAVGSDVLARWEAVLTGLEHDPLTVADRVEGLDLGRVDQEVGRRGQRLRHRGSAQDQCVEASSLRTTYGVMPPCR